MALLTTTEAARRCGVCGRTLLRWLASGELAGTQTPGGHWRVSESELERFRAKSPELTAEDSPGGVVVLEDNPVEAQALARVVSLLAPGSSVGFAEDGIAAGLLLGATRPRVAFVDIEMPGLDGVEVIRRARQVRALERTRFVVVSGRLTPARVAALGELGVREFLKKPVSPEAVRAVLAACGLAARERESP